MKLHFLADTKSRVEDVWKKMNSGLPAKMPKPAMNKLNTAAKVKKSKGTNVSNLCGFNCIGEQMAKMLCVVLLFSVAL